MGCEYEFCGISQVGASVGIEFDLEKRFEKWYEKLMGCEYELCGIPQVGASGRPCRQL